MNSDEAAHLQLQDLRSKLREYKPLLLFPCSTCFACPGSPALILGPVAHYIIYCHCCEAVGYESGFGILRAKTPDESVRQRRQSHSRWNEPGQTLCGHLRHVEQFLYSWMGNHNGLTQMAPVNYCDDYPALLGIAGTQVLF